MKAKPLSVAQKDRLRAALARFNGGEFFECHEILEAAWLEASGEDKMFLQGLIQVAVSFYHLRRQNLAGASRLLRAGLEKLSTPSRYRHWINTANLVETLLSILERIETGRASSDMPAPEICFVMGPE